MLIRREVAEAFTVAETMEGGGVRLHRGFANREVPLFDPFLLFDDFSSPNPVDYLAGFPMHPHRGIETVTYILHGDVRHRDSIGNEGSIGAGDIQWMTAGSGIIHEEMPEGTSGIQGFQLWVNLPKNDKMMNPRYQEVGANAIPETVIGNAKIKIIAGMQQDVCGPVEDIMAEPSYLDISLQPESDVTLPVIDGHTVFIYVVEGEIGVVSDAAANYQRGKVILFHRTGNEVYMRAGGSGARVLFVTGKPLGEPVAWRGPIVMNSREELDQAFLELHQGRFIR